jgi:hypothetical protein
MTGDVIRLSRIGDVLGQFPASDIPGPSSEEICVPHWSLTKVFPVGAFKGRANPSCADDFPVKWCVRNS